MEITDLLKAATSRVLGQREALAARDSLCLQLVLANAKRGGDITKTTITAKKIKRHKIAKVTMPSKGNIVPITCHVWFSECK
jgi:hypothetical protein